MIVLKRTDAGTQDWYVYHVSRGIGNIIYLNNAAENPFANVWGLSSPTATDFGIKEDAMCNPSATYVAYLFAHDTSTDGLIQCGSFTTDGAGYSPNVNLTWEPQYLMIKRADGAGDWLVVDTARGWVANGGAADDANLRPNTSAAEAVNDIGYPMVTGFNAGYRGASQTYIYLAIRRPNKPPTTGTQVYNAIARTGNNTANTPITGVGFAPDFLMNRNPRNGVGVPAIWDRLRGLPSSYITTAGEAAQVGNNDLQAWGMDGVTAGTSSNSYLNAIGSEVDYFFKRAPGVFDVVCVKGAALSYIASSGHSLGVMPELIISKDRVSTYAYGWEVWCSLLSTTHTQLKLQTTEAASSWNPLTATSTTLSHNTSGLGTPDRVFYLFATKAGISKVGSYTGNGSSQTINCGFATGARWILIKRTDSTGDWYVFDTVRGVIAGNDPHLSLNTTAAEVTTNDSIDPDTSGFSVNQVAATNINVTSATYIYLSFA
jgi:hypothetical protein